MNDVKIENGLINGVQLISINDYDDKKLGFKQLHGKELSYNNFNDLFLEPSNR